MNLIVHFELGSVDENKILMHLGYEKFDGVEYTLQNGAKATKRMYWYHLKQDEIKKAAYILHEMPSVQYKITNKFNYNFD